VFDPKIAAWIHEPELASYEFLELLAHYLKTSSSSKIGSNIQLFTQDCLNCFRLYSTLNSLLGIGCFCLVDTLQEQENCIVPFYDQEMKVP
jgi:hypothetical protein